jgi:RHS repeat-associated protein
VQLTRVTNSHADYPNIELEYDANGNLIKDEEGRSLSYDLLSRLVEVSGPDSGASRFYAYDGGDQLSASGSDTHREQQFYRDGKPVNSVSPTQSRTYLSADGVTLAERQEGASPKSLILAGDGSGSVLREVEDGEVTEIAYSAYGYRDAAQVVASHPGYNGEVRDETGWYLLGNGYRAFNPLLMRFHSPDSWSPFGDGGVNAYAYCDGDPINFTDPTGHGIWDFVRKLFGFKSKGEFTLTPKDVSEITGEPLHKFTRNPLHEGLKQPVAEPRPVAEPQPVRLEAARPIPPTKYTPTRDMIDSIPGNQANVKKKRLSAGPQTPAEKARVRKRQIEFNRKKDPKGYKQALRRSQPGKVVGETAHGSQIVTADALIGWDHKFGVPVRQTFAHIQMSNKGLRW